MKKIFISYSDKDRLKMKALKNAIDKADFEIEALVIADQKKPLEVLSEKVKSGIDNCDILIPILTLNSIKSQWVNQEIGYATAKDKMIVPLVANNSFKKLKGFINPQVDCPFTFKVDRNSTYKESAAFRGAYFELIDYLRTSSVPSENRQGLTSSITPTRIKEGEIYTTYVDFKGNLKNGFFDNYVKHSKLAFYRWNVDQGTLPKGSATDAGTLRGSIDISKDYSHSTKGWPKGKYKIYVRIYDHPTPGQTGRVKVDENIHEIEII